MGSITEAIVKIPEHFRNKGYQTYDSFISDFFTFSKEVDFEWNMDNLEGIIRPILLKNKTDYKSFHADFLQFIKMMDCLVVDTQEANRLKQEKSERKKLEDSIKNFSKRAEERKKKIENFQENKNPLYTKKEEDKFKKAYKKIEKEYKEITKEMHNRMKDFFNEVRPGYAIKDEIDKDLKEILYRAIEYDNYNDIFKYVEMQKKHLNKILEEGSDFNVEEEKRRMEQDERERERLQEELDKRTKEFSISTLIKEKPVLNHRKEFVGKNAIQSVFEGELFDKKISSLNENEKRQIEDYIRENAKKFRTKLANKIKTGQRRKLDLPATCKMACKTNGIPMDLQFTKPKKEKSKLVMFLDISGSCSSASKMLFTFMHQMKSVFTNGCETYVFVNSLYDVSSSFTESNSADEFISMVFNTVPVKGVYSDYYRPLETFRKEYFSKLTKDSIVFFMGDARNNKNETGEDYVKAIARKAKKTYWLNTETKEKWDCADSIMSIYGQYMTEVSEIITVGDLLNFLTEAR